MHKTLLFVVTLITLTPLPLVTTPNLAFACGQKTRFVDKDIYTVRAMAWHLDHERYQKLIQEGVEVLPNLKPVLSLQDAEAIHDSFKKLKSIERRAIRYIAIATIRTKGTHMLSQSASEADPAQAKQNIAWALNTLEHIASKNKKYQGYLAEALAYFVPSRHEEALKIFAKLEKRNRIYGAHTYFAYASLLEAKGDTELASKISAKGEKQHKHELKSHPPFRSYTEPHRRH